MPTFSIVTLGCKVNQYDGAALAEALARRGLRPATGVAAPPDLVVINTCCVTATAMAKSRQAIRRAVRAAPDAHVLVAGCYGDFDPSRIRTVLTTMGVPPERIVIAGHHDDLAHRAEQLAGGLGAGRHFADGATSRREGAVAADRPSPSVNVEASLPSAADATASSIKARRLRAVKSNLPGTRTLPRIRAFPEHQRAFVKIQDGCDAFCAYCAVPYARSVVWSRTVEDVEAECRHLVAAGHREIVLCGVFLGAFGRPTAIRRNWAGQPALLPRLLERVAAIDGLWRVRLSSIEPGDLTDELLAVCRRVPTAAPHFHLPMQSGSSRVLRRMNRQYTAEQFRDAVSRARAALDRPALTTDIIVGFPGESDDDFRRTLDLARQAGFAKVHAFPFSAIPGTAAWTYRDQAPPPQIVRRRLAELAAVERQTADAYRRQFVGQTMQALVESPSDALPSPARAATGQAMTDRYLVIRFYRPDAAAGKVVDFRITGVHDSGLVGERA